MHRRNLRVDIDFLAKGLEEAGSLSVGKEVQLLLSPLVVKGGLFGIHTCCIHYRPSIWMIQSITSAVSSFLFYVT